MFLRRKAHCWDFALDGPVAAKKCFLMHIGTQKTHFFKYVLYIKQIKTIYLLCAETFFLCSDNLIFDNENLICLYGTLGSSILGSQQLLYGSRKRGQDGTDSDRKS